MAIQNIDGTVEYEGAVIREMERNGYDDSDFYALVYDRTASCPDCEGYGWKDHRSYLADYGAGTFRASNEDAEISYGLVLTLMEGRYEARRVTDDDSIPFSPMVPMRGCHYEQHPYAASRKYMPSISRRAGVPEPFACATCSGGGRVPHPDGGQFRWIEYGTTRFGGSSSCRVDATDEVKALFHAWVEENRVRMVEGLKRVQAAQIDCGARVRVVRGRKVPVGTEGTVFWLGPDQYASYWTRRHNSNDKARAGFQTDDGEKYFIDSHKLEVLIHDGAQWVEAEALVRPGDHEGMYRTAEGWTYAAGFLYVG